MAREHVLSVKAADCRWETMRGSGAGGQHRNKSDTAVRCTHVPSGAVGFAQDERSQHRNRRLAFQRMAESNQFQAWARRQAAAHAGLEADIKAKVERQMLPHNLKIEVQSPGGWVPEPVA